MHVHTLGIAMAFFAASAAAATTITVTSSSDDPTERGGCKLRNAIIAANTNAASGNCAAGSGAGDVIVFDLGTGNPQINVGAPGFLGSAGALPYITEGVTIDGATGGATRVLLHWAGSGLVTGLVVATTAPGTVIRHLGINNFTLGGGMVINATNVTIAGNFIGTDATGAVAQGNAAGIVVGEGATGLIGGVTGVTTGGSCTGDCNLISGNTDQGIFVRNTSAVVIEGNFIGTDAAGTLPLGNSEGIRIDNSFAVTVGGHVPGDRNLLAGNHSNGVTIFDSEYVGVIGNYIGTTTDGSGSLGNAGYGVLISSDANDSRYNNVGSQFPQDSNIIAFNTYDGVRVFGTNSIYNSIRLNSIHDNALLGIRNVAGGNQEIPPPVITQANTSISGNNCAFCTIDVFADAASEGRTYLGTTTSGTGAEGWTLPVAAPGPHITATATDSQQNTSEFSPPFSCPDFDANGLCDGVDDTDNDGIVDALDDCVTRANANQRDSNGDGYGNLCDGDLNDDGSVNFTDLAIFRQRFGTANSDADMNGDGTVNFADLALFRSLFGRPPGPKGSALP